MSDYPNIYSDFISPDPSNLKYDIGKGATTKITIENQLAITVRVFQLTAAGLMTSPIKIDRISSIQVEALPGQRYVVLSFATGAFIQAIQFTNEKTKVSFYIKPEHFIQPFVVGAPPALTTAAPVAGDTPAAVIGCSDIIKTPSGLKGSNITEYVIARENGWNVVPGSYSLAPGESRQINFTEETGEEIDDKISNTLQVQVGASVGAGWGAVSASISSSLSDTSVSSHNVRLTSKRTSSHFQTLKNPSKDKSMIVVMWQLTDIIHWIDVSNSEDSKVIVSMNTANQPKVPMTFWFDGVTISQVK